MSGAVDELYFNWLYELVADPSIAAPSRTFWNLMHHMYTKEYLWMIPNDDNRLEDGRFLRDEFCDDLDLDDLDPSWLNLGCSMLEMLIALSRRLSFLAEGEPRAWFWHLIDNLGIRISDRRRFPEEQVEEVLNAVIYRTYNSDGSGGLFPLRNPKRDQRDTEVWSQLNAYLLERV